MEKQTGNVIAEAEYFEWLCQSSVNSNLITTAERHTSRGVAHGGGSEGVLMAVALAVDILIILALVHIHSKCVVHHFSPLSQVSYFLSLFK